MFLGMNLYCVERAMMDGSLSQRSQESIKAPIVGIFTVQIPRMDEMPNTFGKFVKDVIHRGVNDFVTFGHFFKAVKVPPALEISKINAR